MIYQPSREQVRRHPLSDWPLVPTFVSHYSPPPSSSSSLSFLLIKLQRLSFILVTSWCVCILSLTNLTWWIMSSINLCDMSSGALVGSLQTLWKNLSSVRVMSSGVSQIEASHFTKKLSFRMDFESWGCLTDREGTPRAGCIFSNISSLCVTLVLQSNSSINSCKLKHVQRHHCGLSKYLSSYVEVEV